MENKIAEKFIDLVAKLYDLSDKAVESMRLNTNEIDTAFKDYYWSDIKDAINFYYVRKNDKTRPTIAKILAILETNPNVKKIIPDAPATDNPFARPTTKIWSIRGDFDKMIDIFIECGVIPDETGKFQGQKSVIDPITDLPMLNPMWWFGYKLTAIEEANPDLFARMPHANKLERLAIALGNKMIPFKVRDWKKMAAELRARNGGVMPRPDIKGMF